MEDAGVSTIEHGGMTITTSGVPESAARASLGIPEPGTDPGKDGKPEAADKPKTAKERAAEAARTLGARGGKAAAEKRAAIREDADKGKPEGTEKPEASKAPAKRTAPAEEGEPESDEDDDRDTPLSKRAQRRVEVATRREAEAKRELAAERQARERERAQYEAELAARRRGDPDRGHEPGRPGGREQPAGAQREPGAKPRMEDYENHEDYLDARDDWNRGEWSREQQRRSYAAGTVDQIRSHVDEFRKHVTPEVLDEIDPAFREMTPYFMLGDNEPVTGDSLLMAEIMYTKDRGPAIMKHLSEHPELLARLRAMRSHPDIRVEVQVLARTIGSHSDAIAGDPPEPREQAPKPAQSKARPPVRPVAGTAPVADGDPMPRKDEEFDAWHARRQRKRA